MQRQILNIEVRIITVVFTRRSSVRSCLRLLPARTGKVPRRALEHQGRL